MLPRIARFTALTVLAIAALASGTGGAPASYTPGELVAEWPTADGVGGAHFSPLSDIGPENVADLEVAWSYRTGYWATHGAGRAGTAFESTPLMVDGSVFVITPESRVVALDAETGEERWTYDAGLDLSDVHHMMVTSRGLSHWTDPERGAGAECATRIVYGLHALGGYLARRRW
jgi:quinoprotein glucose dehydrogenase